MLQRGIVVGFLIVLAACGGMDDDECVKDRDCAASRVKGSWGIDASVRCQLLVESYARYTHRWTDGFLEEKFPRKEWLHGAKEVRLSGGAVEFQNVFGAWIKKRYTCTYDPISKLVTDVVVQ